MSTTPNLGLPLIAAAQAQKHVTHNEALSVLDSLLHLSVVAREVVVPPPSPVNGARYIVGAAATGGWSGKATMIAQFDGTGWIFFQPVTGWRCWIAAEQALMVFDGSQWIVATAAVLQNVQLLGVNATADSQNRLTLSSASSLLFNPSGSHQLKISKATSADTASLLFQTGFSGRAELATTGNDNLSIKISSNGTTWRESLVIDGLTGQVSMPLTSRNRGTNLLINGDFRINQRVFSGGSLAAGAFGHDRMRAHTGGAVYSVSGLVVTHTSGLLVQAIEPLVWGLDNLASMQLTVSVEDLAGGNMTVQVGSAAGSITPGAGRRGVTLTVPASETGPLQVRWGPSSSAVSYRRVQAEIGATASTFDQRSILDEWSLCRRYFAKSYESTTPPGQSSATNGQVYRRQYTDFPNDGIVFSPPMRATPTLAIFSPSTGLSGRCRLSGNDVPITLTGASSSSFFFYTTAAQALGNWDLTWHYRADAEIP